MNLKAIDIATIISGAVGIGATIHSIVMDYKDRCIENKIAREAQLTRDCIYMKYLDLMDHNNKLLDELMNKKEP